MKKNLQELNATHQTLTKNQKNSADTLKELSSVKDENQALKETSAAMPPIDSNPLLPENMKWFLIGGGVLLLGFIMGRVLRRGERRSYRY